MQGLQAGTIVTPVYYDDQAIIERDLSAKSTLRATFVASSDSVAVTLPPDASDPAYNGTLNDGTSFWRAQLRADGRFEGGHAMSAISFGHENIGLSLGELHALADIYDLNGRAEVDKRFGRVKLRAGVDVEAGWYNFDLLFSPIPAEGLPDTGPISGGPPSTRSAVRTTSTRAPTPASKSLRWTAGRSSPGCGPRAGAPSPEWPCSRASPRAGSSPTIQGRRR